MPDNNFIDCHTHTNFAAFENDYREIINRALDNLAFLVNVGTQKYTSRRAVDLAEEFNGVYAVVGLHPIHTDQSFHDVQEIGGTDKDKGFSGRGEIFNYDYYKNLAKNEKVVAIGECGFDYYHLGKGNSNEFKNRQAQAFQGQIDLSFELKKPLMIHCRDAYGDLISFLEKNYSKLNSPPGIIHFFSGTKSDTEKLLAMGFYFTFGGVITFARDYDAIIRMIPNDRILSETDAPYVSPEPYRGKRNEPAYVVEVTKKLAEIKDMSVDDMAGIIFNNATFVFNLKI